MNELIANSITRPLQDRHFSKSIYDEDDRHHDEHERAEEEDEEQKFSNGDDGRDQAVRRRINRLQFRYVISNVIDLTRTRSSSAWAITIERRWS